MANLSGAGDRMSDPGKIEYRVRPVIRWQVTIYEASADQRAAWVKQKGEYDSAGMAYEVGYALCREDHQRLGWPVGDERIQYPNNPMLLTKDDMESELKANSAHYQGLHGSGLGAPFGEAATMPTDRPLGD